MRLSLQQRYSLSIVALVLTIAGMLAGTLVYESTRSQTRLSRAGLQAMEDGLRNYTELRGRQVAQLLSSALGNDLYHYNMQHIYELLQVALDTPGVLHIVVFDLQGRIVHDGREGIPDFNQALDDTSALQVLEQGAKTLVRSEADRLHVAAPVSFGPEPLGGVRVTLSLADMKRTLERLEEQSLAMEAESLEQSLLIGLIITAVMALVAILVSILIGRHLVRPIRELAGHAEEIGQGRFGTSLSGERGDELGDLIKAFNAMSERLRQSRAELIGARDSAEQASRAKSQFLAMISHEIRSPMNGVLGMMDLLLHTPLTPQQKHQAESAYSAAESLLNLINDVLDFSKIEAGRLELDESLFELSALLQEVVALFSTRAESQGLFLDLELAPALPAWVRGDALRLRQVLVNLIGNAVKFTARGGVRVHVGHSLEDDERIRLDVEVQDTGIGIAEEDQVRIFDAFVQADASSTRQFGGTGLGLVISRELVTLMGGSLKLESAPGTGSTFSFDVLLRPGQMLQPQERPDEWKANFRGTVLVCEDNPVNLELVEEMLLSFGCRALTAIHGQAALELLAAQQVDLVLMDCQMPVMDGFETTRRIRRGERDAGGPHLPVVALTANALQGDRETCLAAGMDDYLSKPFTRRGLAALLSRWLPEGRTAPDAVAPLQSTGESSAVQKDPAGTLIGESAMDSMPLPPERIANMKRRVYAAFLRDAPGHLAAMDGAASAGDLQRVCSEAHYLKSSCANIGAGELSGVFREIENAAMENNRERLPALVERGEALFRQVIEELERLRESG